MLTRVRDASVSTVVALAAVLVVIAAIVVLFDLGGSSPRSAVGAEGETNELLDEEEDTDEILVIEPPEVTYELVIDRDPFDPVRPPDISSDFDDNDDDASPLDPPGNSRDPGTRPVPGNGAPSNGGPSNGAPGTPPAPGEPCQTEAGGVRCDGTSVRLLDVADDEATIQVGDSSPVVSVGSSFATDFKLTEIRSECAVIDYQGRQTFRVCRDAPGSK